MNKAWQDDAWEDYLYWQKQDKKTLKKIKLIEKLKNILLMMYFQENLNLETSMMK